MQPWKVSAGLTTALTGLAVLLLGSRLDYLLPFWGVILSDYGVSIAVHLGLALVTVAAVVYGVARAAGLADLGRKVDLVERSIRRGSGDQDLAEALHRDAEGEWDYQRLCRRDPSIRAKSNAGFALHARLRPYIPALRQPRYLIEDDDLPGLIKAFRDREAHWRQWATAPDDDWTE